MYTPAHFLEERIEVLHALIRQFPFATLIVQAPSGLEATHLPLILDNGVLRGHLARANPLSNASGAPAIAIFHGPHQYISPSFYETKKAESRVVPTWNYVAVHAHGPLQTFTDPTRMHQIVAGLTEAFESPRPVPWSIDDAPPEFIAKMLSGITGIEIPIERLEGKWKLSQNRPMADRLSVAQALADDPIGEWVKGAL